MMEGGEKIKVLLSVPDEVIGCIEAYRIKHANRYRNRSRYFAELLPLYLSHPGYFGFELTKEDIVRFSNMKVKKRNNVTFYISREVYAKITKNAEEQMRTVNAELRLFLFSLYTYFKSLDI